MTSCKFILTRGKNKDKECGKNNCKRHLTTITTTEFKDIVQPIIVEKNTNINKCLHNIVFLGCNECKSMPTLGQCDICKISGGLDEMKQHIKDSHKILTIGKNYTSYREVMRFHVDTRIRCPKIGCINDLCNVQENHMQTIKPVEHECTHVFNCDYCRLCINKVGKHTWYCNLCKHNIKQPTNHLHHLHKSNIKCDICKNTRPHTHELIYPTCKLCNFKFSSELTDEMLYTHLVQHHRLVKKCQLDCTGTQCNHVEEYELYNSRDKHEYKDLVTKYNIDIGDLMYTTLKYPEYEILRRIDTAIEDRVDAPDVYKISNDAWGIICSYLSMESKYNMQFVSKRFNEISNAFVTKFEKFQYYYTHEIFPDKPSMCASLAKATFCLTDKDLSSLKCVLKTNPHYRGAAPMRMYNKQDLIRVAFEKHKTSTKTLVEVVADKKQKSVVRKQVKVNKIQERRTELRQALGICGLFIRDDSRVCNEYIQQGRGPNGENLEQVVNIMVEMDWYFKHNYRNVFENIKHSYYGWYDITDVSQRAKIQIMTRYKREGKPVDGLPTNVLELYNTI